MKSACLAAALAVLGVLVATPAAAGDEPLPASPWAIVGASGPRTPPLDPSGPCLPAPLAETAGPLLAAIERGAGADARAALRDLPSAPELRPLWAAWLEARLAEERGERVAAIDALRAARAGAEPGSMRACALLEQAKLELALERLPEAVASTRRALAELDAGQAPVGGLRDQARFIDAEAHRLAGPAATAREIYTALAGSEDSGLAAASRLRLADLRFDAGERAGLEDYAQLVTAAFPDELRRAHWAARVAEVTAARDEIDDAIEWIRRDASLPAGRERSLAAIREADLQARQGQARRSRARLDAVQRKERLSPIGILAGVRGVALGVTVESRLEQVERLRRALRSPDPGLRQYTRSVLITRLLAGDDLDGAVVQLTTLVLEQPSGSVVPGLPARLDAVLARVVGESAEETACLATVRRLGGARSALLAVATQPEPFLHLADCYASLGLYESAVSSYRAAARRFGGELAARVSLPLAHAALELGDLRLASASAEGQVRRGGPDDAGWRLVLAQVELLEGRPTRSLDLLRPMIPAWQPLEGRLAAMAVFARAAVRSNAGVARRDVLRFGIGSLPASLREAEGQVFGEVAYLTADLHRRAGDDAEARQLYRMAGDALSEGPFYAAATYWAGNLAEGEAQARADWERSAGAERGEPWSTLARAQLRATTLVGMLGRPYRRPRGAGL